MPAFFDEVIDPFYEKCPTAQNKYAFGQIFRTPTFYPQQSLEVWRPRKFDRQMGFASDFEIQNRPEDAFRRLFPLSRPPLRTNEEFVAVKGKPRPVILIRPPDSSLLQLQKGRQVGRVTRYLCSVALVYRVEDDTGTRKFPQEFLDRIRRLEYPQFLFLTRGGPISVDSLARVDELQSVAFSQLDPTGYCLAADVVAILKSQISFYLTGIAGQEFADWADLLQQG